jgi:membrane associated rhomboid family serine protease
LPIFVFLRIVTIPAVLFLAFWLFAQLLNGVADSAAHFGGGVAWWAHVGGFVAGALIVLPLRRACLATYK